MGRTSFPLIHGIILIGMRKFKLALIQLAVGASKPANLERAGSLVREAASNGAKLVALPVRKTSQVNSQGFMSCVKLCTVGMFQLSLWSEPFL